MAGSARRAGSMAACSAISFFDYRLPNIVSTPAFPGGRPSRGMDGDLNRWCLI